MAAGLDDSPDLVFVCVCTPDRFAALQALAESVRELHREARVMAWCIDAESCPQISGVELRSIDELRIHDWYRFAFQYTALELCCAIKPHALLRALDEADGAACVYLDTDMLLYSVLGELAELLQDAAIVLVPHLAAPTADPRREGEVLKHGTYNGGVVGVRPSESARAFLRWWRERTRRDCIADADGHLFVDQYWLALVPGLFDGVAILRHPGYNVAYWNIAERPLARDVSNDWRAGDEPLRLFHFSGFDSANPHRLSRYATATAGTDSDLGLLLSEYAGRLDGCSGSVSPEYVYGRLADGTSIDPRWRELIRTNHPTFMAVTNPFDVHATPGLVHHFRAFETAITGRVGWDPSCSPGDSGRVQAP